MDPHRVPVSISQLTQGQKTGAAKVEEQAQPQRSSSMMRGSGFVVLLILLSKSPTLAPLHKRAEDSSWQASQHSKSQAGFKSLLCDGLTSSGESSHWQQMLMRQCCDEFFGARAFVIQTHLSGCSKSQTEAAPEFLGFRV